MGTTPKEATMALPEMLPDNISYETILAEIIFKIQVLERIEEADRGDTVSHEEAKKRLAKWLVQNGP
jgi:predicted transcriptional regulator